MIYRRELLHIENFPYLCLRQPEVVRPAPFSVRSVTVAYRPTIHLLSRTHLWFASRETNMFWGLSGIAQQSKFIAIAGQLFAIGSVII